MLDNKAAIVIILLNNSNMQLASGIANGCLTMASRSNPALRFSTSMSLLRVGAPTQRLYMNALARNQLGFKRLAMAQAGRRGFSDSAVVSQQDERDDELENADENTRLGIDTEFSQ